MTKTTKFSSVRITNGNDWVRFDPKPRSSRLVRTSSKMDKVRMVDQLNAAVEIDSLKSQGWTVA